MVLLVEQAIGRQMRNKRNEVRFANRPWIICKPSNNIIDIPLKSGAFRQAGDGNDQA
jgi:hypothetical protein